MATEQPPAPAEEQQDHEVAITVAAILASGLAASTTLAMIKKAFAPLKLGAKAVRLAWKNLSATWFDPPYPELVGARALKDAWKYRAWFLLNSARRIQRGMAQGVPLRDLLQREIRFATMHAEMQRKRIEAARSALLAAEASMINTGKPVFRWRTREDDRVTPDCRKRNRKIFHVLFPPDGLYPGGVHPRCRCWAEAVKAPATLPRRERILVG